MGHDGTRAVTTGLCAMISRPVQRNGPIISHIHGKGSIFFDKLLSFLQGRGVFQTKAIVRKAPPNKERCNGPTLFVRRGRRTKI